MIDGVIIIGLCGRSGSGKGYVCELFGAHGIPSVDTDQVYRGIIGQSYDQNGGCVYELVCEFGEGILSENGCVDKSKLRDLVFSVSDRAKLDRLNSITHKYILKETISLIQKYRSKGASFVIIDAPVLFESGFDKLCDIKLCVISPRDMCVKRICERDGIKPYQAEQRLDKQMSNEELSSLCDLSIFNDGGDLDLKVVEIIETFGLGGGKNA